MKERTTTQGAGMENKTELASDQASSSNYLQLTPEPHGFELCRST